MEKNFSVKEVATILGYKNEETIKRKIRAGKFPNAFQNSRKEGWRIPASDVAAITKSSSKKVQTKSELPSTDCNKTELVKLAYQVATLSSPSKEVQEVLASLSLERALEICLIIRQQTKPIDEPYKFIKAAVTKKWVPDPITNEKKKRLVELTQREVDLNKQQTKKLPFYNWLEVD